MFGRSTLAALGAAVAVVAVAPHAHAASVTYTQTGFSQRTVVMVKGEPLTITNTSGSPKTFVSTSPTLTETSVTLASGESFVYRFAGESGGFTVTALDATTSPTLAVAITP